MVVCVDLDSPGLVTREARERGESAGAKTAARKRPGPPTTPLPSLSDLRGNMVIFERAAHDQPSILRGRCGVWGFQNAKDELLTR